MACNDGRRFIGRGLAECFPRAGAIGGFARYAS